MACANILLNERSFHGCFQENLEKTEWKPRCRWREQAIFSLPSSNPRMWQGVAMQRFIFPLKPSPENGNDYSQFQIIFFPRLHKSRMLASHFQLMRPCVSGSSWLPNTHSRMRSYLWKKFFAILG